MNYQLMFDLIHSTSKLKPTSIGASSQVSCLQSNLQNQPNTLRRDKTIIS